MTIGPGPMADDELRILEALRHHRLLSKQQLLELLPPTTRCHSCETRDQSGATCVNCGRDLHKSRNWIQFCTRQLTKRGFIGAARPMSATSATTAVHFLTKAGLRAAVGSPSADEIKHLVTPDAAAGAMQAHTLAVNEACLAFFRAAHIRGDECPPLSWTHEVEHPISPNGRGRRSDLVRADAVLHYTRLVDDRAVMLTRFVELDRATYHSRDLVEKLRRYARLHRYVPDGASGAGWRTAYPDAFPHILVVLTGPRRPHLEQRRDIVLNAAMADQQIMNATGPAHQRTGFLIAAVLLSDLREHGPFAPIFRRHIDPDTPVDWLGQGATT